jgi:hypothetical protein
LSFGPDIRGKAASMLLSSLAQPHPGHGHLTGIWLVEVPEDDRS